jgi:hypothetical protein
LFNLLSSQPELLSLLSRYTTLELEIVSDNINLIINLLSDNIDELIENRRVTGILLSHKSNKMADDENTKLLGCEQVLLEEAHLINTINTLCLTEAILVRNNFSNCLEILTDNVQQPSLVMTKSQNKAVKVSTAGKNNVSPIRLTEIKQRLAQAVLLPEEKQKQIKNRLNNLLVSTQADKSVNATKQA